MSAELGEVQLARKKQHIHCLKIGDQDWRKLLIAPCKHDRLVYAEHLLGRLAQVLEYLSPCIYRLAISEEKLVRLIDDTYAFRGRENDYPGERRVNSRWQKS
ncbi:hypothetical protein AAKU64_003966 [Undibacterium sp. GrIS 1.8]|uniref:transposase n=1 Tax=unclassified Undibacterium TaxID=2630295 RepID=UPI00339196A1